MDFCKGANNDPSQKTLSVATAFLAPGADFFRRLFCTIRSCSFDFRNHCLDLGVSLNAGKLGHRHVAARYDHVFASLDLCEEGEMGLGFADIDGNASLQAF